MTSSEGCMKCTVCTYLHWFFLFVCFSLCVGNSAFIFSVTERLNELCDPSQALETLCIFLL